MPAELDAVMGLMCIGLRCLDGAQCLVGTGTDGGDAVLIGAAELAHHTAEDNDRHQHEGHNDQHHPGKRWTSIDEQRKPPQKQQEIAKRNRDRGADHCLDQGRIGGQAREHLPRPGNFEKSRVEGKNMIEDGFANIGDDPLPDPGHEVVAPECREGEHGDNTHQPDEVGFQAGRARREALVQQQPDRLADHQGRPGGENQRDQRAHHPPAIRRDESRQLPKPRHHLFRFFCLFRSAVYLA